MEVNDLIHALQGSFSSPFNYRIKFTTKVLRVVISGRCVLTLAIKDADHQGNIAF